MRIRVGKINPTAKDLEPQIELALVEEMGKVALMTVMDGEPEHYLAWIDKSGITLADLSGAAPCEVPDLDKAGFIKVTEED